MLTEYIEAAMKRAQFEILPEDQTYYGEIPVCPGVWANEETEELCREELRSVLEDWILVGLKLGHELPVVDSIDLNLQVAA